ncbi:MAG TPA: response regulator transcription factor [Steroidobacteraceae bacterium]|jgi:DNA-binding NarL/FixJ family response regulator|nr:response regulator transcription factor [Steroidobacteraceae bacterium]
MGNDSLHDPVALIVDDHVAVRRALCERVQASFGQFRLREAGTVDEALKIIESERVDIVLMDFRLPGRDGVDGTRMVLERSPLTSVIMVSIFDDSSHRSAAKKAGARAFISKRAISKELIPTIANVVTYGQQLKI